MLRIGLFFCLFRSVTAHVPRTKYFNEKQVSTFQLHTPYSELYCGYLIPLRQRLTMTVERVIDEADLLTIYMLHWHMVVGPGMRTRSSLSMLEVSKLHADRGQLRPIATEADIAECRQNAMRVSFPIFFSIICFWSTPTLDQGREWPESSRAPFFAVLMWFLRRGTEKFSSRHTLARG